MKKMIALVIIMMTLGANSVAAQKYYENTTTGKVMIIEKGELKELSLQFDGTVPSFIKENPKLLTTLKKEREVELSRKHIKGTYYHFYYTPRFEVEMITMNDNGLVSYSSFEKNGKQQFAWLYVLGVMGIFAIFITRKTNRDSIAGVAVAAVLGAIIATAIIAVVLDTVTALVAGLYVLGVMGIFAIFITRKTNRDSIAGVAVSGAIIATAIITAVLSVGAACMGIIATVINVAALSTGSKDRSKTMQKIFAIACCVWIVLMMILAYCQI
ncbi:MAG: hypothetical protein PHU61_00435 [Candidatus Absconditabacteria bacterium]|nr:hypothetical protein [Candidatus Absconditabacteria bacterium]MDD3868560.1 hypothetical protein [Candidatus Absconditabacteria bacterium]MDD4714124.1 hypothetical protein [Candidatus Absconditabacteria bacterium]